MGGKKQRHYGSHGARHGFKENKKGRGQEKKAIETHSNAEILKNTLAENRSIAPTEPSSGVTHFSQEIGLDNSSLHCHVDTTVSPADTSNAIPLPSDENKNAENRLSNTLCAPAQQPSQDMSGLTTKTTRTEERSFEAPDPSTYASTNAVWSIASGTTPYLASEGTDGIQTQEEAPPKAEAELLSCSDVISSNLQSENTTLLETPIAESSQLKPSHPIKPSNSSDTVLKSDNVTGCPPLEGPPAVAEELSLPEDDTERFKTSSKSELHHEASLPQTVHQKQAPLPSDPLPEEQPCTSKPNTQDILEPESGTTKAESTEHVYASDVTVHDRMEPLCNETVPASICQDQTNKYPNNNNAALLRQPCATPGATDITQPETSQLQQKTHGAVGKKEASDPTANQQQTQITEGTPVVGHDVYRLKGNQLLKEGHFDEAIAAYTLGLEINPRCHILLSNRSTAYMMKNDYASAVEDASACVAVNPGFAKGYSRRATALWKLDRLAEALLAAETGLTLHAAADEPEANVRILRYTHQQIRTALLTRVLCGRWKGTVHPDLGGYEQIFEFENGDSSQMRCIVMGRTMNARYVVRLPQHPDTHRLAEMDIVAQPSVLGDSFIPPPTVPYVFRLICRCPDSDSKLDFETLVQNPATLQYIDVPPSGATSKSVVATHTCEWDLEMCAPYLSIDRPTNLSGPGFVLMKKESFLASTASDGEESALPNASLCPSIAQLSLTQQVAHYLTALGEIYPSNGKYVEEPDMDDDQVVAARKVAQLISEQSKLYNLSQRYTESARSVTHHLLLQQEPFTGDWPASSSLDDFESLENTPIRHHINRDLSEGLKTLIPTTVGLPDTTVDPDALPELKVLAQHTLQHLRTTGLDVILFAVLQPHLSSGDAERDAQCVTSAPFLHPLTPEDAGAPSATVDSPTAYSPSGGVISPASTSVAAFASATRIPGALSTMASLHQPTNSSTDTTPMTGVDGPLEIQPPTTSDDPRNNLNNEASSDACCHRAQAVWKWMQKNKVAVSVTATVIALATTAAWVFYSRGAQRTGKPSTRPDPQATNPFKRALSTDLRSRS